MWHSGGQPTAKWQYILFRKTRLYGERMEKDVAQKCVAHLMASEKRVYGKIFLSKREISDRIKSDKMENVAWNSPRGILSAGHLATAFR